MRMKREIRTTTRGRPKGQYDAHEHRGQNENSSEKEEE